MRTPIPCAGLAVLFAFFLSPFPVLAQDLPAPVKDLLEAARAEKKAGVAKLEKAREAGASGTPLAREALEHLTKAQGLYEQILEKAGENEAIEEELTEVQSLIYWARKMTPLRDEPAPGGASAPEEPKPPETAPAKPREAPSMNPAEPQASPEAPAPSGNEERNAKAKKLFDEADRFAAAHPAETLSVLARYFRIADQYRDTLSGIQAMERCIEYARRLQEKSPERVEPRGPAEPAKPQAGGDVEKHPCPGCAGTGHRVCDSCSGRKTAEGACKKCSGAKGNCCPRCKGEKEFPCARCKGSGEGTIWVPGRGMQKGRCSGCNGHGKVLCGKCHGTGTEKCSACDGKGTGPCPACGSAGLLRCPLCAGSGNHKDSRAFVDLSYRTLYSNLTDPEKTDLQRISFWEDAFGKTVVWPAIVVNASRDTTGYYVAVNLDRSKFEVRTDAAGNPKFVYPVHALVYVLPSEVLKISRLEKGAVIWVVGQLGVEGCRNLALKNAEVYPVKETARK